MAITGVNHITLAVTDLTRACDFYENVLGARCAAHWPKGAYLELGTLWLCLEHATSVSPQADDSHIALSCTEDDFDAISVRIEVATSLWKSNMSEGASLYFHDPDGHKLELHVGTLASRLASYANDPDSQVMRMS